LLSAERHPENQPSRRWILHEWRRDSTFNEVLQPVQFMPYPRASREHGNEAWIPDRARPENSLPFKVSPEVEDPFVPVDCRPSEAHDDLETIPAPQIEGMEERGRFHILDKFRQTSKTAIRDGINGLDIKIQISADATPVGSPDQGADDATRFRSWRQRRGLARLRTQTCTQEKDCQERTGLSNYRKEYRKRQTNPDRARLQSAGRKSACDKTEQGKQQRDHAVLDFELQRAGELYQSPQAALHVVFGF
jgi:hypothetical protein